MDFHYCISNSIVTPEKTTLTVESPVPPVQLSGPFAARSRTLPTYTSFSQVADDRYTADVLDPAVWSPDHPVFYKLKFSDETVAIAGIRKVEPLRGSLFVDGRRTVLRGSTGPTSKFDEFTVQRLSLLTTVQHIDEDLLRSCTEQGIPLVVLLRRADSQNLLATCSSWPCVIGIGLPIEFDAEQIRLSRNVLRLAQIQESSDLLPGWAHGIYIAEHQVSDFAEQHAQLPVIFAAGNRDDSAADGMSASDALSPSDIRRKCEQLQCRLAPQFDLAGYFV